MKTKPSRELLQTIDLRVAETMKRLRLQQSMTLSELGSACGLSSAYLSRVENHRAALTLHNLALVASALKSPLTAFFEEDEAGTPLAVCRAGKGKVQRVIGRRSIEIELLAAEKMGKLMEPIIVEVQAESKRHPLRSHIGEEFNLVMEGRCIFTYGNDEITLFEGDSVYYDASIPHAVHACGNSPCKLLAVVVSRDYLFHGDISRLLKMNCR